MTMKGENRGTRRKKNLCKCHSVHHECHMDYPQFESTPRLRRGLYGLPLHGKERSTRNADVLQGNNSSFMQEIQEAYQYRSRKMQSFCVLNLAEFHIRFSQQFTQDLWGYVTQIFRTHVPNVSCYFKIKLTQICSGAHPAYYSIGTSPEVKPLLSVALADHSPTSCAEVQNEWE